MKKYLNRFWGSADGFDGKTTLKQISNSENLSIQRVSKDKGGVGLNGTSKRDEDGFGDQGKLFLQGYIERKSNKNGFQKKWKVQYFVLKDSRLRYYKDQVNYLDGEQEKGEIYLNGISINFGATKVNMSGNPRYVMLCEDRWKKKVFVLAFTSEQERNTWYEALQIAVSSASAPEKNVKASKSTSQRKSSSPSNNRQNSLSSVMDFLSGSTFQLPFASRKPKCNFSESDRNTQTHSKVANLMLEIVTQNPRNDKDVNVYIKSSKGGRYGVELICEGHHDNLWTYTWTYNIDYVQLNCESRARRIVVDWNNKCAWIKGDIEIDEEYDEEFGDLMHIYKEHDCLLIHSTIPFSPRWNWIVGKSDPQRPYKISLKDSLSGSEKQVTLPLQISHGGHTVAAFSASKTEALLSLMEIGEEDQWILISITFVLSMFISMDGDNLNLPALDITSCSSTSRSPTGTSTYARTPIRQDSFGEWSHSVPKTTQSCVGEDLTGDETGKGIRQKRLVLG
uniref:PH domain-containing protein n=1 Tax=Guillardia theta TaxID=55529 RepID=A0A7S4HA08_GUITH|mmetsp:Transcript_11788/g.40667  ORF Transcript_11788/g.40667 Transcript_11788/m.40667 type:complete len:507 (+) Transcript_11788:124-1644(+)